jgi:uncharacterized protein (TIGR00297 family)
MSLPAINLIQIGIGILAAGAVSALAYRFRLLTSNGSIAAFILGAVVFGLGGLDWSIVLIAFFLSSSALSFIFKKFKVKAEEKYAKGSTRDFRQVFANGGLAGLFVIANYLFPGETIVWVGFCAAFAAANADTWATELGVFSRKLPRLITNGKEVEPGTSGAVSIVGSLAAMSGAALIGLLAWLIQPESIHPATALVGVCVLIGGVVGSMVDSCLGATLQAIYNCPTCEKETEKHPLHGCGSTTHLVRGHAWMDNDLVNLLCTAFGALTAVLLTFVLFQT